MKNFKSIVESVNWDDVQKQIIEIYPDHKNSIEGYNNVFNTLLKLIPAENNNGCTIIIKEAEDDFDGKSYYAVSGLEDGVKYAIEYCSWEEWLGYYVDDALFEKMSVCKIVACCLYEMTWGGFTQDDIKKHLDEITWFDKPIMW